MSFIKILKLLCPPLFLHILQKYRRRNFASSFAGNYSSWAHAKQNSGGYDAENILTIIQESALKVKRGEAVFERDSVCFHHVEYRYSALSGLLYAAVSSGGKLSVLDFGGSLASFYSQHAAILSIVKDLRWGVVEQPHFVAWGREHLTTTDLKFYNSLTEFILDGKPNCYFSFQRPAIFGASIPAVRRIIEARF